MKSLFWPTLVAAFFLVGCQSPVSNPTTVTGSSTLPLGSAAGVTVYAADASGYGLLYYGSSATNWLAADWSSLYPSTSPYSSTMTYPPVYDVAVGSGTIYAATKDGLLVGSGSSWTKELQSSAPIYGVTATASGVYASTSKGLFYSTTPATAGSWGATLISTTPVFQWAAFGSSAGVAATSLGLYSSSSPTTVTSYTAVSSLNSNSPNTAYYSGSTLYVGTPVGLSKTTDLSTWANNTKVGAGVNGILSTTINSTSTLFLATTTGIEYTQSSNVDANTSWNTLLSGVGVNNIVVGANTSTYYYANGVGGLGILQIDSSGSASVSSVLTWANIAKVYVTSP